MSRTTRPARPFVRVGIAFLFVLMALALLLGYAVSRPPASRARAAGLAAPVAATLTAAECAAKGEVRLDNQAWFTAEPDQHGHDFGHTHAAFCYPVGKVFDGNGSVNLTVLLTMHDNPGGRLTGIAVQVFGNYGAIQIAKQTFSPAYTCADTCSWFVTLTLDLTKVPKSGTQELRIRPTTVESDGAKSIISTSLPIPIASGKPVDDYRGALWQGKSWYAPPSNAQYAQAQYFGAIPTAPVTGAWSPTVGCHSSALPVTGCLVTIDPNFHEGNNGTILYQGNGAFKGRVTIPLLPSGWHALVIRSSVRIASLDSTSSGVLGISFYVP